MAPMSVSHSSRQIGTVAMAPRGVDSFLVTGKASGATALQLRHAFVNQPVEVPAVRGQFATYLVIDGRRPDLVMRFGYGPELPRSLRRSST
jgi:hypothetical protein